MKRIENDSDLIDLGFGGGICVEPLALRVIKKKTGGLYVHPQDNTSDAGSPSRKVSR